VEAVEANPSLEFTTFPRSVLLTFAFLAISLVRLARLFVLPTVGGLYFMYRYISHESCSQFDSLPLTSLTVQTLSFAFQFAENRCCGALDRVCRIKEDEPPEETPPASVVEMAALHAAHGTPLSSGKPATTRKDHTAMEKLTAAAKLHAEAGTAQPPSGVDDLVKRAVARKMAALHETNADGGALTQVA
jgi:hypothetical protein